MEEARLQFRHDKGVYGSFNEIKDLLNSAVTNGNLNVLLGEPYVFHYMNGSELRTVLAIGDTNNAIQRYALLDIDRIMDFTAKDAEILKDIDDLEELIADLGIAGARLETESGETSIILSRSVDSDEDDIIIPLTDFRNDISDEIDEAANEALQNAKDYAKDYTDSAVTVIVNQMQQDADAAKAYTDSALTFGMEYTDTMMGTAMDYTDSALDSAKTYTDEAISAETAAREDAIADEESARKEADNALLEAISALTAEMGASDADQAEKIENLETRMSVAESGITVLGDTKVDKEAGKGLSTNDYTNEEKAKLAGIENGAQANIIEKIRVNGIPVGADSAKTVDIEVPFQKIGDDDTILTLSRDGELKSRIRLEYDSTNKLIKLYGKNDNTVISTIDANAFIKDGMVSRAYVDPSKEAIIIAFNTDAEQEDIEIPLSSLVTVYTIASGESQNYLEINDFVIRVKTGPDGLATGEELGNLRNDLAWSAHTLEDEIDEVQRQIGTGFTDVSVTRRINELETKIDGAIDSLTGLSTEGVIRDNFTDSDGNRIARSGVTTVTEAVGNIVNVLNTKAKENLTSNIVSGNTTISGLTTAATITEAIQTLVNIIGDNGSGKIEEDITISGETIVSGGTPVSGAIKTILERLVGDENAISDLDERLREIEEEGSLVRNLVGDEDIEVTGPDESGITHVSLLGISNPDPIVLDMERTVIIRFQGVSRPDITESSYWGTGYTFTTPETENPTDRWKIDMNLDGDTEDPVDIIVNGGEEVTVDLTNQGENAIITAKLYQQA